MSIYNCPKGHESTESDYCSECGAKINGASNGAIAEIPVVSTKSAIAQAVVNCPDCTAPHDPGSGDFCEICGYNFVTGAHGELPILGTQDTGTQGQQNPQTLSANLSASPPLPLSNSSSSQSPVPQKTAAAFEVVATIDPSLGEEGSPPPPTNQAPIPFRLDKESHLIGRHNERRGIYPDIALDFDDAVSHRHALLNRQSDGTFVVRDIGSTNGTKLNGVELAAMVDTPLQDGDELTLGHWTRLTIKVL